MRRPVATFAIAALLGAGLSLSISVALLAIIVCLAVFDSIRPRGVTQS